MPDRRAIAATHRVAGVALSALALLFAGSLHAGNRLLRGTVGQYPVVMELDTEGDSVSGTYFYERYRQDIPLRGEPEAKGYRLSSAAYDGDEDEADHFVLVRDSDGFKGSFVHGKGGALPVELRAVAPGSIPDPRPDLAFEPALTDYEKLRITGVRFVPGKEETVEGKYRIRWYSEPLSGISLFRVVGGYPETAMAAINRTIERDHYASLMQHFGCADGEGGSGDESTGVTSRYLDDRFVSYAVSSNWSCYGAAHPDFGVGGTTIDAATGRELSLEDVYRPGGGDRPARGSDAWYRYRENAFAPAVIELFRRLYPARMKGDGEDGCDYSDPSVWSFGSWYLTERGLYLGAYFARFARACDNPDWSIVPYDVLEKNNPAMFGH